MAKARRRKKTKPFVDRVIRGCLDDLRRGDVDTAGVLADYLEESGHKLGGKVRRVWQRWRWAVEAFRSGQLKPRRTLTRWEELALYHGWLRHKIGKMFGREWRQLSSEQLNKRNRHHSRPVPVRVDE